MESIERISCWPPSEGATSQDTSSESDAEDTEVKETELLHREDKRPRRTFAEPEARVSLAVWFRRNQADLPEQLPGDLLCAKSRLNHVGSSPQGRRFLQSKLRSLETDVSVYSHSPEYYYVLATYCDFLRLTNKALDYCWKSLRLCQLDPELVMAAPVQDYMRTLDQYGDAEKDALWLWNKLSFEKKMRESSQIRVSTKEVPLQAEAVQAVPLSVDVVQAQRLSISTFQTHYCAKRKPLVISDCGLPTSCTWTLEYIRSKCGDRRVVVKSTSEHSTEWAHLEETETKSVADFIDQKIRDHYLFDWSLPLNAPELAAEFAVPKYFEENVLTQTSAGALYRNSWPSLFLGPKGTKSGLHVDAFGSHFWMYLVSGVKRWTFYPAELCGDLSPVFYDSMDPVFKISDGDLENIKGYTIDLQAGHVLFVPSGSPHRVENLEDTVAVSGNFVNRTNLAEFTAHLKINAIQDPRSRDLLAELDHMKILE